jgi:BirA family biotin operon repressor/biotin-[acetyl-CoA-carboxylase] ligase
VSAPLHLPPGYDLRAFDEVGSTNDEAKRLAEDGAAAGLVVTAQTQSRGRGRHGRRWSSPPGNLYATVLLRPDCPVAASAALSLVSGLALAETLGALGPEHLELRLKWPNDVLIGAAKVAGILLETAAGADGRTAWVIVGTGVNIASAPTGTTLPATSLAAAGFGAITPQAVLEAYLEHLAHWYGRWRQEGFEPVRSAWLSRGFGVGRTIRLRLARGELSGRFVDLTAAGMLLLEEADGRRREVAAGDVLYGH